MTDKHRRQYRVAIGGILHETHGFAPTLTTLADFRQTWFEGPELVEALQDTSSGLGGMIEGIRQRSWQVLPTFYAAAMPAGLVEGTAYQALLAQLCSQVANVLPVDGLLLHLHGAMVTETTLDAETEIVAQMRRIVGRQIPIVVVLDMHGNINPDLAEQADVLLAYDTNPHIDLHPRGMEAVAVLEDILAGNIRPVTVVRNLPFLLAPQVTDTSELPLRALHTRVREMEQDENVVAISVLGGFVYADTPWTGASVIVCTHDSPDLAASLADELGVLLTSYRDHMTFQALPPDQAVREALQTSAGPVILVDSADNIGGGTPGDGTDALRAMLAAEVQEGTVVIADPAAVRACQRAGLGARLTLQVGGKTDDFHGSPVEVAGEVRALSPGVFPCELQDHHFAAFYGATLDMGDTAWFRAGGVNIVLNTRKTPPFDLAQLRGIGIVPEQQKMIAVKAAVAYRTAYLPIAAQVIEMDTAGLCSANMQRFPFRHIRRPVFPLDAF